MDEIVFLLDHFLISLPFVTYLNLSLTCKKYSTTEFRSKIFTFFKLYVIKRLETEFGVNFTKAIFDNNFCIIGGFLLDCIYDTRNCSDLDLLRDKITFKKAVKKDGESIKAFEPFIIPGSVGQYLPGYETDPKIWSVESYGVCVCCEGKDDIDRCVDYPDFSEAEGQNEYYCLMDDYIAATNPHKSCGENNLRCIDFINIENKESVRQFVSNFDFNFCQIVFDGKSLFINNAYAVVTKKCSLSLRRAVRNFNRSVPSKLKLKKISSDDPKLKEVQEYAWLYDSNRVDKYVKRGFTINVDKKLTSIKPKFDSYYRTFL